MVVYSIHSLEVQVQAPHLMSFLRPYHNVGRSTCVCLSHSLSLKPTRTQSWGHHSILILISQRPFQHQSSVKFSSSSSHHNQISAHEFRRTCNSCIGHPFSLPYRSWSLPHPLSRFLHFQAYPLQIISPCSRCDLPNT